jgi:[acyl-carrier-protein] S-malonyltransferase
VSSPDPTMTVARVGLRAIGAADVAARLARLRSEVGADKLPVDGSPEDDRLRRWLVQTLIDEAIVRDAARDLGGAVRCAATAEPVDDGTALAVFEAVTREVRIELHEIARFYLANRFRFEIPETRTGLQAVVSREEVARTLAGRARAVGLERAADLPTLDLRLERLTWRRGAVGGRLEPVIFAAATGQLLGPIASPLGWHVLRLERIHPAATKPLDAVAEEIHEELAAAARGARFDAWLADRRCASVEVLPGFEHPGDPGVADHHHRH